MRTGLILAAALALAACSGQGAPVPPSPPAPAASLSGGPWLAEDVAGGGVPDIVRIEMTFDPAGRVSGRSGCNRFSGGYTLSGAALSFGPLAGTRMACPPALMDVEAKVLSILAAANRVSYDATGAAFIHAADGRSIKLRRG